jgi:hypothetical protein
MVTTSLLGLVSFGAQRLVNLCFAFFVKHADQLVYQRGELLRIMFFLYAAAQIGDSLRHKCTTLLLTAFIATLMFSVSVCLTVAIEDHCVHHYLLDSFNLGGCQT